MKNFLIQAGFLKKEESPPKESPQKSSASSTMNIVTEVSTLNTSTEYTEVYKKIIKEALNKRNAPGPDFLEFYKALLSLNNQPIPEQQKYIAAFSGLQVVGLTKEILLSTVPIYLNTINDEEKEFSKSIDQFNISQIEDKQKEIQKLSQENIELQKKIQNNITKISNLTTEVNQNTQKSLSKRQNFDLAINEEKNTINTILEKIKTYL